MSAIEYLMSGGMGMANIGGDLSDNEQELCAEIGKKYGNTIKKLGIAKNIPASKLSIFQMNVLFVGKDTSKYHFVFIEKTGVDTLRYIDLSKFGNIKTAQLIPQLRLDFGEPHWSFSIPVTIAQSITDDNIELLATQYLEAVLKKLTQKSKSISDRAIASPELAKYIEAFKADYPDGQKTVFIIMQFSNTTAHDQIVQTIKDTLKKHKIIGLRADDKEYADDLLSNIKTYMHCTDFGIGVFERILEDDFNPNVSLEVGYMMGLGKNVSLLKDKTLKNLPTDLIGKLYKSFDPQDITGTLPKKLEKWMIDKGII